MKANDILNTIKNIVGEKTELSIEEKLAEIKLENGTILTAEKFESGKSVFIKTEDEDVALPIGEYELEDGKKLIVKEEGLIDTIKEKLEEEKEEEEEKKEEKPEDKKEDEEKDDMQKYVTKEEFKKAVEEIKNMVEKLGYKDEEEKKEEMQEEKEELSAVASEPVKHNPEAQKEDKFNFQISSQREKTTRDRAMESIINN